MKGKRKQRLKVGDLCAVVLDVFVIKEGGEFFAVVSAVVKFTHFVLVDP